MLPLLLLLADANTAAAAASHMDSYSCRLVLATGLAAPMLAEGARLP